MAPFRWPKTIQDICLCKEVCSRRPLKASEWDQIAETLSKFFSAPGNIVDIKGRACREHLDRLIEKKKNDDTKTLKR